MKKFGIAALGLTLLLMIPFLFVLSRNAISANQYFVIVAAVLLLVLWTIPSATLIDRWLRRSVGALFNVKIEWRRPSKSMSWTPDEETGCLTGLSIDLLGYCFSILWLVPFAGATGLVLWLRH